MGVLDDAIREHLELKRKHGAPEEELRRQEEEALGPARREVPQQPGMEEASDGHPQAGEGPAPAAVEAEPGAEAREAEAAVELPEADAAPAEAAAHLGDAAEGQAAEADVAEPEAAEAEAAEGELAHAEPPPTEVIFAPPPPESPADVEDDYEAAEREEGAEHGRAEDEQADEGPFGGDEPFAAEPEPEASDDEPDEGEDADVLEDTPDFLQETPEHDRLWFEQKPPRDFDFD